MTEIAHSRCPKCGASLSRDDLLRSACPACLIGFALESETAPTLGFEASGPDGHPEQIDRYRNLGILGEGGMGTVYLAEQTEPIRRRVALKLIKLGMDSRQVVARFESERLALALMNHPNVAKVYDAGVSDDGRPFFVMEYVSGARTGRSGQADELRRRVPDKVTLFLTLRTLTGVR